MMTYSEMEREINEIPKFGAKASLSNLSDYLELANHPERNLRVIHIAGTNGKGSVSAYTVSYTHLDVYKRQVYGAYYSKMLPFIEEQLLKGRINEHLAYLYTCFQKEVLEKPDNWKAVCDILFYHKLICTNPHIIGVYVSCPELGTEKYYPLSGGTGGVETVSYTHLLSAK